MKTARLTSGTEYPIGKILCIGRNYVEHIRELGNETPAAPVIFSKPASSVIYDGGEVVIPAYSRDCHHEAELSVLIGTRARDLTPATALSAVAGYGIAIDLTLRDVQAELKAKGLPWDIAKGFDTACPLSPFVPAGQVGDPQHQRVRLTVNGRVRQDGETSRMITPVAELLSYLSGIFTLEPGDVVLTGTPAGVGAITFGDRITAELVGIAQVSVIVRHAPTD